MPKYTFEIICEINSHPQGTQDETAPTELSARKAAIQHRISGRSCDICGSDVIFSFNGNPLLIDGQPPVSRSKPQN